jgi:dihydrolipoamide dehydrogenase
MAYDLIVIGTGPGGYVCAIRAAQLGLKTAVVEKRATYGGTCLNIGCIPSKALLHASELFDDAGHTFGKMGIGVSPPKLDLAAMMAFKDQGVDGNVKGVDFLFRKNKIEAFHGSAHCGARQGQVTGADGRNARSQIRRHCHRLGCCAPEGHRDRRKAHSLIHRRADAARGAENAARRRRRRDRT